jgi:hypothetical protein
MPERLALHGDFAGPQVEQSKANMRNLGGLSAFLLVLLSLIAHHFGWVDGPLLLRTGAVAVLVVLLVGVVRLPWDLTFQARGALARQRAARARGQKVNDVDIAFAKASATRALWLALVLHVLGAGLAFGARAWVGDEWSAVLALAFLASMALRPIAAFYQHTRARLFAVEREADVPHADALSLAASIANLEEARLQQDEARETEREALRVQLAVMEERMREDAGAWRRSVAMTDEKLERVLREFERTVEKTQQSAEVLAGIRAFVKLVRES